MSYTLIQLSLLAAVIMNVLAAAPSLAAPVTTSSLFELSEASVLSSSHTVELAAKCGAGSCGADSKMAPKKDGKHQCGSQKDGKHQCGSQKDKKKKEDGSHKCGAGSCASTAPKHN